MLNKIIASAILSILNVLFWWSIGQVIEAIALGMIASLQAISYHFIINRLLFFVITLINSYDDILFERKYKSSADATVIKTVADLDLEEIENSETSLVFTTAKLHFEKWKDAREYYGNLSNLIVYAAALFGVALSFIPIAARANFFHDQYESGRRYKRLLETIQ